MTKAILARFVDITNRCIYPVEIIIEDGIISAVHKVGHAYENDLPYALPGL